MSAFDKLKNYINVAREDYDDDFDTIGTRESAKEEPAIRMTSSTKQEGRYSTRYDEYAQFEEPRSRASQTQTKARKSSPQVMESHVGRVVDVHTTAKVQVVIINPEKYTDATEIADHLIGERTVIVNLENVAKQDAIRLIDFLSGVAYSKGGTIKKIAKNTFIITPYNVDVMGDLLYEIESNNAFLNVDQSTSDKERRY